jgi:hypothetical protein
MCPRANISTRRSPLTLFDKKKTALGNLLPIFGRRAFPNAQLPANQLSSAICLPPFNAWILSWPLFILTKIHLWRLRTPLPILTLPRAFVISSRNFRLTYFQQPMHRSSFNFTLPFLLFLIRVMGTEQNL